jgi:hypothetical protein
VTDKTYCGVVGQGAWLETKGGRTAMRTSSLAAPPGIRLVGGVADAKREIPPPPPIELPLDWLARWRGTMAEALPPLEYSVPKLKLLWLAPPLFMIWTNSHGGFLAGLGVYLAYLTLRGVEAYAHKGRAADGLLRRFGLMGAAAVAATFLNPYGPLFHLWIFNDVSVPRPEILEWRAPELFNTQFLPFWLLLVAALGSLAFSRRPRDFTQVVVLGLILWQALQHHRHIAFFAIACGWWLPLHFDSLLVWLGVGQRFKTDEEIRFGWAPPENKALFAAFSPRMQTGLALGLVVGICLSTGQLAQRLTTLKVDRQEYPLGAAQYIAERGLTGKMVCTFNWAQYVLAGFGPHHPGQPGILVQVDGRCRTGYTQEQLDMHFDFILGEPDPQMRWDDLNAKEEGRPDDAHQFRALMDCLLAGAGLLLLWGAFVLPHG